MASLRALTALAACVAPAGAQFSSTFDTGLEGWQAYFDGAISHSSTIGNPPGSALVNDFGTGQYFGFQAPASWAGNRADFYGGLLQFDLLTDHVDGAGAEEPDVTLLHGLDGALVLDLPAPGVGTWASYTIRLDTSLPWRNGVSGPLVTEAQFRAALADLKAIRIRGEFSETFDHTYLDNVRIEPGTDCPADLSGSSDPNDLAYGLPDGVVDAADFFFYLDQFSAGVVPIADLSGSSDPNDPAYGVPDGALDASDFFYYLDIFVAGCP